MIDIDGRRESLMSRFIYVTCGTQFAETDKPPQVCEICEDDRQYVGWGGQQWTTLDEMRQSYRSVVSRSIRRPDWHGRVVAVGLVGWVDGGCWNVRFLFDQLRRIGQVAGWSCVSAVFRARRTGFHLLVEGSQT